MVTPASQPDIPSLSAFNRGFIPEETLVAGPVGTGASGTTLYRPFWRPVLAGAFFTLATFVLSWYLMLGCHVGIRDDGVIDLGAGSAVWLCVTACIAYFIGSFIASAMTASPVLETTTTRRSVLVFNDFLANPSSWLKGAVLWAISIPLGMLLDGFLFRNGYAVSFDLGGTRGNTIPLGTEPHLHLGYFWSIFIGLALGLVFSLIGSMLGSGIRRTRNV